ncbi:hypothetical protein WR164_05320 [Philodulcilactobacillus myokoensis]|uniref:Uncharacterized protein n=1 Tax=Philodulcilactobacillus myokoensis TaxID=2929573 RepID=A0A9W6ESP4_9LACO|nr:LBP_cg2779 family protein [Philodulcilactobacillus myokoensis]GLB46553.1 hypothetical protein WR164_05320 [Philodulcilactobacillus myokoensis]
MSRNGFSKVAKNIIDYEKKMDLTDTQMAFDTHLSVERIHGIKAMEITPTSDEEKIIEEVITNNENI